MYKIRLKVVGVLLVLTCVMTSFAFSQPPTGPTQMQPAPALKSDEFIKKVTKLDAETQSKLDAAIAKLLGSSQSAGAAPIMAPPTTPVNAAPETQTFSSSPEETIPTAPPPPPQSAGGGLNMLGN